MYPVLLCMIHQCIFKEKNHHHLSPKCTFLSLKWRNNINQYHSLISMIQSRANRWNLFPLGLNNLLHIQNISATIKLVIQNKATLWWTRFPRLFQGGNHYIKVKFSFFQKCFALIWKLNYKCHFQPSWIIDPLRFLTGHVCVCCIVMRSVFQLGSRRWEFEPGVKHSLHLTYSHFTGAQARQAPRVREDGRNLTAFQEALREYFVLFLQANSGCLRVRGFDMTLCTFQLAAFLKHAAFGFFRLVGFHQ